MFYLTSLTPQGHLVIFSWLSSGAMEDAGVETLVFDFKVWSDISRSIGIYKLKNTFITIYIKVYK